MSDPIKRLRQLIGKYAEEEGCSRSQVDQIVALVDKIVAEGVPEDSEQIKRILERIGGGN
tara:strand:+ start:1810 stop:1989 length:180 start_codon:yes stop_codon:yes gene_type:complete